MSTQLALALQLRDDATFTSFYPGNNQHIVSAIQNFLTNKEQLLYLWSNNIVGKTHLLHAASNQSCEYDLTAAYLPLASPDWAEYLTGLDKLSLLCLDDFDSIAGNLAQEQQIFHLFNNLRDSGGKLLVSAKIPPSALAMQLPDLQSRLSWGITYNLQKLSDQQIMMALKLRARLRGLQLSDSVINFLLNRLARNMKQLFIVLEKLDQASLAAKRKITIPFAKEVLGV